MDSGVADEIIKVLMRETGAGISEIGKEDSGKDVAQRSVEGVMGEREHTVEVAATAALCNLITEFSPLQAVSGRVIDHIPLL
jgi:hypothetical protein